MPKIWIVAGPNGAGKSSFIQRAAFTNIPIVNPDIELARNPDLGEAGAGRVALEKQNRYLNTGRSFVYETTFSQARPEHLFNKARKSGHMVNLVYVGVASPQVSIGRVMARVQMGGHNVRPEDVIRRFNRSMKNFQRLADQADRLLVLDNSGMDRRMLVSARENKLLFSSERLPTWYKDREPQNIKNLRRSRQQGLTR